jgi:hypothetical protein
VLKRPYDKAARRLATLRRFGLTPPDYARLLLAQDGVCGICKRPPKNLPLHVDHDHQTMEIRGLLCHRCNRGLGFFKRECAVAVGEYLNREWTGYVVPKRKRRR